MLVRLSREERGVKAQQSVDTHLQQHAGEKHRASGRGFDVRIRQPGVEREERDLYGERYEETEEEELGRAIESRNRSALDRILDGHIIEAAGMNVEPDD